MKNPQKPINQNTVKYADIGFRMMAIVIVLVLAGIWLDKKLPHLAPLFTASLSIFSVIAAMYVALKGLSNKK